EILGAMGRGVEVKLGVPADEGDHLVHPPPAPKTTDDGELGEVDVNLIEMPWMAEVVGAVHRVVHGRVDAHRNIQLHRLGIERVVATVAGGNAIHEGGDAEGLEALLAYAALQLAHALHADEAADARQSDEAV